MAYRSDLPDRARKIMLDYGFTFERLRYHDRHALIAECRQLVMWSLYIDAHMSIRAIGRLMLRHHSTAGWAIERISRRTLLGDSTITPWTKTA